MVTMDLMVPLILLGIITVLLGIWISQQRFTSREACRTDHVPDLLRKKWGMDDVKVVVRIPKADFTPQLFDDVHGIHRRLVGNPPLLTSFRNAITEVGVPRFR
jgi:hypothetical protein